jgi:hypothetical protein
LNCFIGCHGVLLFELHFAARGYVGDVFVNGQKKDVWCRIACCSHRFISLLEWQS